MIGSSRHSEIDLHGCHPHDDDLFEMIESAIRRAWEDEAETLCIIHGHGHWRGGPRPFANTNTGYLGITVRSFLRDNISLRPWMFAKIDVSHDGSTTVRIRPKRKPIQPAASK